MIRFSFCHPGVLTVEEVPCYVAWGRHVYETRKSDWVRRSGKDFASMLSLPQIRFAFAAEADMGVGFFYQTCHWYKSPPSEGGLGSVGFKMDQIHELILDFVAPTFQLMRTSPDKFFKRAWPILAEMDEAMRTLYTAKLKDGVDAAYGQVAKMAKHNMSAPNIFLLFRDPRRGGALCRALLYVLSEGGLGGFGEAGDWGEFKYSPPLLRPELEQTFVSLLQLNTENTVHFFQQMGFARTIVLEDFRKLSLEKPNTRTKAEFTSRFPVIHDGLRAGFAKLPHYSLVSEAMHGKLRDSLRPGESYDYTDLCTRYAVNEMYPRRLKVRLGVRKRERERAAETERASKIPRREEPEGGWVRRPSSTFVIFSSVNRRVVMDQNEGLGFIEIGQKLGTMWRELTSTEKQPYKDLQDAQKARYLEAKENGTDYPYRGSTAESSDASPPPLPDAAAAAAAAAPPSSEQLKKKHKPTRIDELKSDLIFQAKLLNDSLSRYDHGELMLSGNVPTVKSMLKRGSLVGNADAAARMESAVALQKSRQTRQPSTAADWEKREKAMSDGIRHDKGWKPAEECEDPEDRQTLLKPSFWGKQKRAVLRSEIPATLPLFWIESTMRGMNKNVLVALLTAHLELIAAIADKSHANTLSAVDVSEMGSDAIIELFVKASGTTLLANQRKEKALAIVSTQAVFNTAGTTPVINLPGLCSAAELPAPAERVVDAEAGAGEQDSEGEEGGEAGEREDAALANRMTLRPRRSYGWRRQNDAS